MVYDQPMTTPETRWLTTAEDETWRAVWALTTWLPARLDAQLRADVGISQAEYHALSQISEAPDRTIRLSEVAASANMTLSHLSRVITRLEKAGLVTRFPDPTDGRYTLGKLTDAGLAAVVAAAPGHVEEVRSCIFDNLTADEAKALGEAAGKIVEAMAARQGG